MKQVLLALIGALAETDEKRAMRFVVDVLATQLHGLDIADVWDIDKPMGLLTTILANEGKPEPETRLLWCTGKDTILACYHIGVYCNKELIGKGK